MNEELVGNLDETFHAKARLGIMTLLLTLGETDFSTLKSRLGLTDGNLGAHLRVLEEAGYVGIQKKFVGRRPRTSCSVTAKGRKAFDAYIQQLEAVLRMVGKGEA